MAASSRGRPKALRPECTWPGCHRRTRDRGQPLCAQHEQERPQRDTARQRAQKRSAAGVAVNPFVANVPLDKYTDSLMTTLKLDGMTTRCDFCLAWNFADEKVQSAGGRRVTLCCKAGKICHLPTLPDAPEPLRSLLLDSTPLAKHFRQNIRRYNAAICPLSHLARVSRSRLEGPIHVARPSALSTELSTIIVIHFDPTTIPRHSLHNCICMMHKKLRKLAVVATPFSAPMSWTRCIPCCKMRLTHISAPISAWAS